MTGNGWRDVEVGKGREGKEKETCSCLLFNLIYRDKTRSCAATSSFAQAKAQGIQMQQDG
jgi:hypothetical protein